jgi:hypothetical protein
MLQQHYAMPLHYNTRQQQQQQPAKSRQQPLLDANINSTGLAGCCLCQLYCWLPTFPDPDVALSTHIQRSSRTSHARSSFSPSPPLMHVGTHLRVQPSTCFLLLPAIKLLRAGADVSPAASNAQDSVLLHI